MDIQQQFTNHLTAQGFKLDAQPLMDGSLQRFFVEGAKPGSKPGWAVCHTDENPVLLFGDWRTGTEEKFFPDGSTTPKTPAEKAAIEKRVAEAQKQRADTLKRQHDQVAAEAQAEWDTLPPAPQDHPYLVKKGIKPHGAKMSGKSLAVAAMNALMKCRSIQYIAPDGGKMFKSGGEVKGNFYAIPGDESRVFIGEGFATMATVHQATGNACYVAFNAGNLEPVAKAIRAKYPKAAIIITGDDDKWTEGNPGRSKAEAAARAIKAKAVFPVFLDVSTKPTDLNDLAALEGLEAVRRQLTESGERKIGFRFIHVSELGLSAPEYLIDGLLETDSMAVFFGDTGAMKSAFLFGAAFSVTSGTPFHGRKVKQGPVILIIGEGQQGFTRRKAAWEIRHQVNLSDCPLYISSAPADMTDPAFMKEMAILLDQITEKNGAPALIVIDTLAANFGAADENATKDMNCFVQSMNSLRARYQATVATAHHVGQADKTRGRGNRALKAGIDAEYFLERDEELNLVRVFNHKMKEGAPPKPMAFKPVVVELPIADQEGRPVTSFVLDEVSYEEPEAPTGKTGRGRWQQAALDILADLYSRHEGNLEAGGYAPDGARVTVSDWREAIQKEGLKNRSTFVRLQETLTKQKKIRVDHGYVELLG